MAKEKKLYKRKWLNKGEGVAFAELTCSAETSNDNKSRSLYADLTLGDCSRKINLEFSVWGGKTKKETEKEYKERLKKIKRLKAIIDELEQFMLANPPVFAPRKPVERQSIEVEGLGTVHVPKPVEAFLEAPSDSQGNAGDEEE